MEGDDDHLYRYVVLLCVCVRAFVFVPIDIHASVHGFLVVSFSRVVSLCACVSLCGQGLAWINVWVTVSVCMSVCACVSAYFGF